MTTELNLRLDKTLSHPTQLTLADPETSCQRGRVSNLSHPDSLTALPSSRLPACKRAFPVDRRVQPRR